MSGFAQSERRSEGRVWRLVYQLLTSWSTEFDKDSHEGNEVDFGLGHLAFPRMMIDCHHIFWTISFRSLFTGESGPHQVAHSCKVRHSRA